jgi:hypothetical protein
MNLTDGWFWLIDDFDWWMNLINGWIWLVNEFDWWMILIDEWILWLTDGWIWLMDRFENLRIWEFENLIVGWNWQVKQIETKKKKNWMMMKNN